MRGGGSLGVPRFLLFVAPFLVQWSLVVMPQFLLSSFGRGGCGPSGDIV